MKEIHVAGRKSTGGEKPISTIALVDDDQHILTSVSMALESEGYLTQTYSDGATALTGLQETPPDVAILDIKMPRMDGMELLRRLREHSDLPVIFLTSKEDEIDELFGLKMGADDFIRKPFSQHVLMERIKVVLRRAQTRKVTSTNDIEIGAVETGRLLMDPERHTCTWSSSPVALTVIEFRVLRALARRPGIFKSRDSLLDEVYPDQTYVEDRTVDSYIKRLRRKFEAIDASFDAIETRYGIGYRFNEA